MLYRGQALGGTTDSEGVVAHFASVVFSLMMGGLLLVGRWTPARLGDGLDPLISPFLSAPTVALALGLYLLLLTGVGASTSRLGPSFSLLRSERVTWWAALSLTLWLIASALRAPPAFPWGDRVVELSALAVSLMVLRVFSARSQVARASASRCARLILVLLAMLAVGGLIDGADQGGRLSVLGGGPNAYGRSMALLSVGTVWMWSRSTAKTPWGRRFPGRPIAWLVGSSASAILVVLSGSRGAMAGLVVGIGMVLGLGSRSTRTALSYILSAVTVVALLGVTSPEFVDRGVGVAQERIVELTLQQGYTSSRAEIFRQAVECGASTFPWGAGLGGFSEWSAHSYPHNVVLQAFCEGGLVALSAVLVALGAAFLTVWRNRTDVVTQLLAGILAVSLMSSLFSGDFFDARWVLVCLGVIGTPFRRILGSEGAACRSVASDSTGLADQSRLAG